jgi:hypothetical protein
MYWNLISFRNTVTTAIIIPHDPVKEVLLTVLWRKAHDKGIVGGTRLSPLYVARPQWCVL